MLRKKTIVKNSPIAGVGLFADEEIKKGEIVWQYHPETSVLITEKQFQILLNSYQKTENHIIQYYLIYGFYVEVLNGLLVCLDDGRFVNHSEEPNMGAASDLPKNQAWQYSIAKRDIKKGEELTENYRHYDQSAWQQDLAKKYQIF